jgi:hypothetical protein
MYEPEWLTWWKSLNQVKKDYLMYVFFKDYWKANPMNYMIKHMYTFFKSTTLCN